MDRHSPTFFPAPAETSWSPQAGWSHLEEVWLSLDLRGNTKVSTTLQREEVWHWWVVCNKSWMCIKYIACSLDIIPF